MSPLKVGTRVNVSGRSIGGSKIYMSGRIVRWTKVMGPRDSLPAAACYEPVRFDDTRGVLLIPQADLVILSNAR